MAAGVQADHRGRFAQSLIEGGQSRLHGPPMQPSQRFRASQSHSLGRSQRTAWPAFESRESHARRPCLPEHGSSAGKRTCALGVIAEEAHRRCECLSLMDPRDSHTQMTIEQRFPLAIHTVVVVVWKGRRFECYVIVSHVLNCRGPRISPRKSRKLVLVGMPRVPRASGRRRGRRPSPSASHKKARFRFRATLDLRGISTAGAGGHTAAPLWVRRDGSARRRRGGRLRASMATGERSALSDAQKLQVVVGNCIQKAVELILHARMMPLPLELRRGASNQWVRGARESAPCDRRSCAFSPRSDSLAPLARSSRSSPRNCFRCTTTWRCGATTYRSRCSSTSSWTRRTSR